MSVDFHPPFTWWSPSKVWSSSSAGVLPVKNLCISHNVEAGKDPMDEALLVVGLHLHSFFIPLLLQVPKDNAKISQFLFIFDVVDKPVPEACVLVLHCNRVSESSPKLFGLLIVTKDVLCSFLDAIIVFAVAIVCQFSPEPFLIGQKAIMQG
ncbi:unnamed protein product [Linum trigynum]|uniref:Uncharacterized protein n=1 Tax=Linum trigynum TaxID=586398 RepID=A0AAV2CAJ3_9ROSI